MKSTLLVLVAAITLSACAEKDAQKGTAQPVVAKVAPAELNVAGTWKGYVNGVYRLESSRLTPELVVSLVKCADVTVSFTNVEAKKTAKFMKINLSANCVDALGTNRKLVLEDSIAITSPQRKMGANRVLVASDYEFNTNNDGFTSLDIGQVVGPSVHLDVMKQSNYESDKHIRIVGDIKQFADDELYVDVRFEAEASDLLSDVLTLDGFEVKGTLQRQK